MHSSCPLFWWEEHVKWNRLPSAERGKAIASHLCQHTFQEVEEKGHFLPAWVQIQCSLYSLGVHIQKKKKKKSCSDPQNNPKRATGRFDNGTVHWERAEDLSPQVTKQPKEKALFHTWAMPHAPDSCFLFHTELCFHIYCCKCFRATRSWRIRILTPQESRLVGDLGAPPLRREPFF